jgi:ATP-binding cassette subfamily B protein
MDCGPTCLRMVARYYGRKISLEYIRNISQYGKQGVSMLGLSDAAETIGLKSVGAKLTYDQLINDAPLPAIIHWEQFHFVVLTPQSKKNKLVIADPAKGLVTLNKEEFLKSWLSTREQATEKGIVLLLEATSEFKERDFSDDAQDYHSKLGLGVLKGYIKQHKIYFLQILLGLFIGSLLQLIFPYLTQSIVDTGINTRNINFIEIVLAAQLMLLFSQTIVEFIRNKILLHVSTRVNISLLSGFWAKLLRLPLNYFDNKHPGDIIQRINDHDRIEKFLTGTALSFFFAAINLCIFSFVLLQYSVIVVIVFAVGSLLYFGWIRIFLAQRRKLDYRRFAVASKANNAILQLVYGMQEIKLNNAENSFRWGWEGLQAGLFKINFSSLSLAQYQQIGAFFINQGKNITITFIVAKLVIDGSLTLGMMLAIQYIIGQLNSPVEQLISFSQQAQDAKISLQRLNDIHSMSDEEPASKLFDHSLPTDHSIQLRNVSFTYSGDIPAVKDINLVIPQGKVTAIIGTSGSGKSTLLKLILKFYENYTGDMYAGGVNMKTISPKFWRSVIGTVMQDSYIFNDNIRKNITVADERIDEQRLISACQIANILTFIESLPLGFYTKLGAEGNTISGGQKQRLAIARAVYKNPQFIFFDEATNSLDANNEKEILDNLQHFFQGKTVVVVAHRLSTVKNADKIVVMEKGQIVEEGTHTELTLLRGKYYELVKNQLELGN